jgi:hypothetical protein
MKKLAFAVSAGLLALIIVQPSAASQQYQLAMHNRSDVYALFRVWDQAQTQPHKFCVDPGQSAEHPFKGSMVLLDVVAYKDQGCRGRSTGLGQLHRRLDKEESLAATLSGGPTTYKLRWS